MIGRLSLTLLLLLILQGCTTMGYYAQSIGGHLSLMGKSRPIGEVLKDPATSPELKARLLLVRSMRAFAVEELQLPDNGSYHDFADLNREAVVWSLVAAPEFSIEAKTWCYPFIGCASYRGYFDWADVKVYADKLALEGLDVAIEPIPAYSTLGWFDDPVPSTVIEWLESRLAGLIFHELSHQLIYVKDDSAFNESFATTVEQLGVERWLLRRGEDEAVVSWRKGQQREKAFVEMLLGTRARLGQLYALELGQDEMRRHKARVFEELKQRYEGLRERWGGYKGYDRWFNRGLNNARLASIATYEQWVPAFMHLLQQEQDVRGFYAACRRLADLPYEQRQEQLRQLLADCRGGEVR